METKQVSKAPVNKRRLSDRFLRRVEPPAKTTMYWDDVQGGFGVQVTPNGAKSFKVVYRHRGRLRWYTIDRFPAIGLADAREIARQIRAKAALGKDPQGEKVAARHGDTLADIAELYVERYARHHNKSWQQAHTLMQRYVLPSLGSRKIRDITRRDVRQLFDTLTIDQQKPVLANQVLAAVSRVLSWAVEKDIIEANLARGIKRNKTKSAERFLSDEELVSVWPELDNLGYYQSAALRLILLTAQRPGEVCAMRWRDVDMHKAVWTLLGDPEAGWPGTKNGRTHEVPLSASALALLHDLDPQESGPIFPHKKGWFMPIPVTKEVWKALGIPRFRPHDLRATAASGMDALGIHKEHISRLLNHVEGGTTAGYIRHDHMDQKRRALEAWDAHLTAVVEGREKASGVVDFTAAKAGRD